MARKPLSPRQAIVLAAIETHMSREGVPPTLRELGAATGIRSTNGVQDHLRALERKGYIETRSLKARGVRLLAASNINVDDESLATDMVAEVEAALGVRLDSANRVRIAGAFRRILAGRNAA